MSPTTVLLKTSFLLPFGGICDRCLEGKRFSSFQHPPSSASTTHPRWVMNDPWRRASSLRMRSCFAPPLGILTLWWVEMIHSHNGVGVGCWWMAIRIPWKSNQVGLRTTIFFNSKGLAWFKRNHHFLDGCWLPGYIFCIPRWKQQVWTPWFIPWWMAVYVYTYIYIYTPWMKGEFFSLFGQLNERREMGWNWIH